MYPAVSSANDYPFMLPEFRVDEFKKNIEELLIAEEKPQPEASPPKSSGS
jgi:hypothetical protein